MPMIDPQTGHNGMTMTIHRGEEHAAVIIGQLLSTDAYSDLATRESHYPAIDALLEKRPVSLAKRRAASTRDADTREARRD